MMDQRERTAMQRVLAHEAIGKLRAVGEWFGVDDASALRDPSGGDLAEWQRKIDELERWIWDESPIA
jgi:hypothetical protein